MFQKGSLFSKNKSEVRPHRLPPLFEVNCGWCGLGKKWHNRCLLEYNLAINHKGALRKKIWARDKGVCNITRMFDPKWEADHVQPLFRVDRYLPIRIVQLYFLPCNIQTLSKREHLIKTKREMAFLRKGSVLPIIDDPVRYGLRSGFIKIPEMSDEDFDSLKSWLS